jgi:hypothetical protein
MKCTLAVAVLAAFALIVVAAAQAAPSTYLVAPAGQVSGVAYGFAGTIKNPIYPVIWEYPSFTAASCDELAGLTPVAAFAGPYAQVGWSIRSHGRAETWTFNFLASAPAGTCQTVTTMLNTGAFTDPQLILITP